MRWAVSCIVVALAGVGSACSTAPGSTIISDNRLQAAVQLYLSASVIFISLALSLMRKGKGIWLPILLSLITTVVWVLNPVSGGDCGHGAVSATFAALVFNGLLVGNQLLGLSLVQRNLHESIDRA